MTPTLDQVGIHVTPDSRGTGPAGYRLRRRFRKSASLTHAVAASAMTRSGSSAKPGTPGNPGDTLMPRAANSARAKPARPSARPSV